MSKKTGFIVVFDTTICQQEVIEHLVKNYGYHQKFKSENNLFSLPHNTLFTQRDLPDGSDEGAYMSSLIGEVRKVVSEMNKQRRIGSELEIGLSATFVYLAKPWCGTNVLKELMAPEWTDDVLKSFSSFQKSYKLDYPDASKEMVSLAFIKFLENESKKGKENA